MKLIYETAPKAGKCPICLRIDVVTRKLYASKEKVDRWMHEGRNPVTTQIEKDNINSIQHELMDLNAQKLAKLRSVA